MAELEPRGFESEEIARKTDMVRELLKGSARGSTRKSLKLVARGLYCTSRVILGAFLHPVATFKASMLIGDREEIRRNFARSMSVPGFKGSEKFTL